MSERLLFELAGKSIYVNGSFVDAVKTGDPFDTGEISVLSEGFHRANTQPELLEALKAVVADRAYQQLTGSRHFTSAPTEIEWKQESAKKAWAKAEAAIAKAEDRS